jgi:hypothetical protein
MRRKLMRVLCTFSGKFGDILWSLPTARDIAIREGESRVDFAMMPTYKSLVSLLHAQPYIRNAFVIEDWLCVHSNHGDQPWEPPKDVEESYDKVYHLGYRGHPGINAPGMPLIDFIAWQQGIKLSDPVPFIEVDETYYKLITFDFPSRPYVAYSFNNMYESEKNKFWRLLQDKLAHTNLGYVDTSKLPWLEAAAVTRRSLAYVGCRSSNWVLAIAMGKEPIIEFEPHPARNAYGSLGHVFGCPYLQTHAWPQHYAIEQQVDEAAEVILERLGQENVTS